LTEDHWELYDVRKDFSLSNDVAKANPKKLAEMQKLFMTEAVNYNVLPIDDRLLERFTASAVGRPDVMSGRTSLTLVYLKDGKPAYTYNFLGLNQYTVSSPEALPAGKSTVVFDFSYDGGGLGKAVPAR
jgi:hypothetical protein